MFPEAPLVKLVKTNLKYSYADYAIYGHILCTFINQSKREPEKEHQLIQHKQ